MSAPTVPVCSACASAVPDPAERWPDKASGTLCQCCWEAYSSRLWWSAVLPLMELEQVP
jgi:hypothetical protein